MKSLFTKQSLNSTTCSVIYLYNDQGVSAHALAHTLHTLKTIAGNYKIECITAQGILHKAWDQNAALFIMPGGADVPYTETLNGKGNDRIKQYVEKGGNYLGLCAGAYYGADFVEFDKNGPLEVVGERALKFFPDKAIGPVFGPYEYDTNRGARAALLCLNKTLAKQQALPEAFPVYYNGGGYFNQAEKYPQVDVMGYYQLQNKSTLPALLKIKYKRGIVILSGVHFEYSYTLLDSDTYHDALIPLLKKNEPYRIQLAHALLASFGMTLKSSYDHSDYNS